MTGHACLQSTSYFFPALTLLTFWVTFCVTFHLTNTPLHDFIYESNNGHDVFFVETEDEAVECLCR